jgi:hypothetical protein
MSFNYNPADKTESGGGKAQPGTYKGKVDQITETTFRSGNDGWKVKLMVGALPDRDITVYCNLVQTPAALWKFEEFCNAFGFDFNSPPPGGWNPGQFEGKTFQAVFKAGEKYLEVDQFLPASANNGPDAKRPAPAKRMDEPPPPGDDDCPI